MSNRSDFRSLLSTFLSLCVCVSLSLSLSSFLLRFLLSLIRIRMLPLFFRRRRREFSHHLWHCLLHPARRCLGHHTMAGRQSTGSTKKAIRQCAFSLIINTMTTSRRQVQLCFFTQTKPETKPKNHNTKQTTNANTLVEFWLCICLFYVDTPDTSAIRLLIYNSSTLRVLLVRGC